MESVNLLVTDKSPESAEQINSLLRNSGIRIHVIHASKVLDVKKTLDQTSPLLVLYIDPDPTIASVEEVSSLARNYSVPFALYSDFQKPDELIEILKETACLVIHSENESLLIDTVKHLATGFESTRNQTQQREQMEELEHRYELILGSARDAMAYIHEGLHVYANRAYLEILRVSDISEITGSSLLEFMHTEGTNLKKLFQIGAVTGHQYLQKKRGLFHLKYPFISRQEFTTNHVRILS